MTKHAQPVVPIVPNSLTGVLNEQPGPGHAHWFRATVEVEVEVDWKVDLVAAKPDGISPVDRLLKFNVVLPHGAHSDAIAKRTLHYEEKPPRARYRTVTIEDGAQTTTAEVKVIV